MKVLTGYLIDRETGVGIASKDVDFLKLDGTAVTNATTYVQSTPTTTDGDGKFVAWFELSPGPVDVVVDAIPGVEVKVRKHDEKAQFGYSWSSDISRFGRAFPSGVINDFLNELAVTAGPGHQINIATGAAVFNGSVFSIENGPMAIAGTSNPAGPANPRIDLLTLRQYNETAAGQDSGRQEVVVTLGTVTSVAPATPTGSSFIDLPIATLSTAIGGASKTVTDLRVFTTPSASDKAMKFFQSSDVAVVNLTTSYQDILTVSATGLDPNTVYDGELYWTVTWLYDNTAAFYDSSKWSFDLSNAFFAGGIQTDRILMSASAMQNSRETGQLSLRWPIQGVTGVASSDFKVRIKSEETQGWLLQQLTNRIAHVTLTPRL